MFKLFNLPHLKRSIVATLLLIFLSNIIIPTVSWALTSGPTAPEATSFEPVDTTDMVNLATGDFTYNMPLLEVPGPAGGYPLSLSYHAGIQTNEEASWVGLGWTLNPGAITRNVVGFPDDHNAVDNVNRVYWEGGETSTVTVGVSVGVANFTSVSAGLSFSQDTYKGFGVGISAGFSAGVSLDGQPPETTAVSAGLSGQIGVSAYGQEYGSIGVGISVRENIKASFGASYNTTFNGDGGSISAYGASPLIGASISSSDHKGSVSIGGSSASVRNSKSGNVSTSSSGFTVDIPTPVPALNVRLGYNNVRYWIDESVNVPTYGSLYYPTFEQNQQQIELSTDVYHIYDVTKEVNKESDPMKDLGGTFPNYDKYYVNAQGLSGSITPSLLKQNLIYQSVYKMTEEYSPENFEVISLPQIQDDIAYDKVEFRFENEFSNTHQYDMDNDTFLEGPDNNQWTKYYSDDAYRHTGFKNGNNQFTGTNGNNGLNGKKLLSKKNIEWYTNKEVQGVGRVEGLIAPVAEGFSRRTTGKAGDQIGAFMITKADGVTYHYALPAYSFNEKIVSKNYELDTEANKTRNTLTKSEPYAYTWFLTSVTGPDYYDVNQDGLANEGDWGYWVNFEYGKWASNYKWRNPGTGHNRDLDSDFINYAYGEKEVYYLNYIKTQTHTAAFVKEMRADAKGVINEEGNKYEKLESDYDNCRNQCANPTDVMCINECLGLSDEPNYNLPVPSLALDNIILFKNNSNNIPNITGGYSQNQWFNGNNVLDVQDFNDVSADVLRKIQLNHNYSLAPGTFNSFDPEGSNYIPNQTNHTFHKLGKLTLNAIQFLGKSSNGNAKSLPPTIFSYGFNPYYFYENYDSWGFHKVVDSDLVRENENLGRATTNTSSLDVDAWSLNNIKTPLGESIQIRYESDEYNEVGLKNNSLLNVTGWSKISETLVRLNIDNFSNDLLGRLKVGSTVNLFLMAGHYADSYECGTYIFENSIKRYNLEDAKVTQVSTTSGYIYVEIPEFISSINNLSTYMIFDCASSGQDGLNMVGWTDFGLIAGTVGVEQGPTKGGGLRVKRIRYGDNYIGYNYQNGVTPFEPFVIPHFDVNSVANKFFVANSQESGSIYFQRILDSQILHAFDPIISNSRELPSPGVIYAQVDVTAGKISDQDILSVEPGYLSYKFQTFDKEFIDMDYSNPVTKSKSGGVMKKGAHSSLAYVGMDIDQYGKDEGIDIPYTIQKKRKLVIKDFTNRMGLLKNSTNYDELGNKVSAQVYHYLHDDPNYLSLLDEKFSNQGLYEEAFSDFRVAKIDNNGSNVFTLLAMLNKRAKYPVISTGVSQINYEKGIKQRTYNLAYDFYSGELTRTLSDDGKGNYFLSETVPAYKRYPAMGLKSANLNNKNMLSQASVNRTMLVNLSNETDPYSFEIEAAISASASNWQSYAYSNVWRKSETVSWVPSIVNEDGTFGDDETFYIVGGSNWETLLTFDNYDIFSHPLQVTDFNGISSSLKYDNFNEKVVASANNASLEEFRFVNFEDGISFGNLIASSSIKGHTGAYSGVFNSSGGSATVFYNSGSGQGNYRLSFWTLVSQMSHLKVNFNGVNYNATDYKTGSPINGWQRCEFNVPKAGPLLVRLLNNSGTPRVDDIMFGTVDSNITGFVYNDFDELTHIVDNNNLYTRFEYDDYGRLEATYKESLEYGEVKVSEHLINFGAN